MKRIYCPSKGPDDWKALLAEPEKQWRSGYSAMTTACCWESAEGLPPEIGRMFEALGANPQLLLALVEHKVPLPGSALGDSQSDVFAFVRAGDKTFATTIEGKVDESFDRPLSEWRMNESQNKKDRLTSICQLLELKEPLPGDIYYQLLHRTAAAVIEAYRFKTDAACMIVHSFSPTGRWYDAFERFVALFGVRAERGRLLPINPNGKHPLYVGWATGDQKFLSAAF
jgi:hypothetical protein